MSSTLIRKEDFFEKISECDDGSRYKLLCNFENINQLFIAELRIPQEARHNENEKRGWYRADSVTVERFPPNINVGTSAFSKKILQYDSGCTVRSRGWDENLDIEDSVGIHYFETRGDLIAYVNKNYYTVFADRHTIIDLDGNILLF